MFYHSHLNGTTSFKEFVLLIVITVRKTNSFLTLIIGPLLVQSPVTNQPRNCSGPLVKILPATKLLINLWGRFSCYYSYGIRSLEELKLQVISLPPRVDMCSSTRCDPPASAEESRHDGVWTGDIYYIHYSMHYRPIDTHCNVRSLDVFSGSQKDHRKWISNFLFANTPQWLASRFFQETLLSYLGQIQYPQLRIVQETRLQLLSRALLIYNYTV